MIDELEKIVGAGNVSVEELDRLVYSSDASQLEGKTQAVVWPLTADHVSDVLKFAKDSKIDVVPRGGGTSLVGGVIPDDSIVLDMSKLNQIVEVNKNEKYAIVEPGVILEDLNIVLKEKDLLFPVVPASKTVCTLGGVISTNAVGERALKYGRAGDWIISLEAVNGAGKPITLEGDKAKDLIGSEGCLAVLTKLKLRLAATISERSISSFEFDDLAGLVSKAGDFRKLEDTLAIEYVGKAAAEIAGLGEKHLLYVEHASDAGSIKDPSEVEELWAKRDGVGAILSSKGYTIKEDPKIPLEKLKEFLIWLEDHNIISFGHISVGILHPRFKQGQEALIRQMFKLVEDLGGNVSGEHGIGITKREYVSAELSERIKNLKKKYDPDGVLNRGKICQI